MMSARQAAQNAEQEHEAKLHLELAQEFSPIVENPTMSVDEV